MPESSSDKGFEALTPLLQLAGLHIAEFQKEIQEVIAALLETKAQNKDPSNNLSDLVGTIGAKILSETRSVRFKEALGRFVLMTLTNKGFFDDDFEMDPAFYVTIKPLFDFLYNDYWRVDAKGLAHVPTHGRGLIVANHSGVLPYDGMMVRLAIENRKRAPRDVRFLVENFVSEFPLLENLLLRIGGVRGSHENATRLLNKDRLIAVFPEGAKGLSKPFRERYQLKAFGRGGYIRLALKTKTPIIPTAIIGAEEVHPMIGNFEPAAKKLKVPYFPITPTFPWLGLLGLIPLPTRWTITFGKPISLDRFKASDADKPELVEKLSKKVIDQIQKMLDDGLKKRKSVWFG